MLFASVTSAALNQMLKNVDQIFHLSLFERFIDLCFVQGAKIHAENAIRQKNQALNFLRMSARVDAISSRVQTAIQMKNASTFLILKRLCFLPT